MHTTTLNNWPDAHATLRKLAEWIKPRTLAGRPVTITVAEERRTLDQNAMLWALLEDVAKQVDWHGQRLDAEDWKQVFTAALKQQRAVPGINGGFVVLGSSTRNMDKATFSDLIDLISSFGADHGVTWSKQ